MRRRPTRSRWSVRRPPEYVLYALYALSTVHPLLGIRSEALSVPTPAPKRPKKLLSSLRNRGHSYTLPHTELPLYKNSFINRCLFSML